MDLTARIFAAAQGAVEGWRGQYAPPAPVPTGSPAHYAQPVGPTGARGEARKRWRKRTRTSPLPIDQPRWLRSDIEAAQREANNGLLRSAGKVAEAVADELTVGALLENRCEGLVNLPRIYRGSAEARVWLEGEGDTPGVFERVFPPGELALLAQDELVLGVGLAQWVHPEGDELPHIERLDPQWLRYLPGSQQWQYTAWGAVYNVNPGDGFILHAKGRQWPWRNGLWFGLGLGYVSTIGAALHRDGFIWKFANPAVAAVFPQGASEDQKRGWYQRVLQWGLNSVWGGTAGYDIKIFQPNATGREVFNDAQDRFEKGAMRRIAGQEVSMTGGVGFANASVFASIAADKVKGDGKRLAATLNEQALPQLLRWASSAVVRKLPEGQRLTLAWDTTPPVDRKAMAEAISAAAKAKQDVALAGYLPDAEAFAALFQLPVSSTALAELSEGDEPTPDHAAQLAEEMTAHKMERCEHGRPNKCPICGVERLRGVVAGPDGAPTWRLGWRPITEDA